MCINRTSLVHPSVNTKVFKAMQLAVRLGFSQYVKNKKGESFLRVRYNKKGFRQPWQFVDKKGRDVTALVLSVLKGLPLPVREKPATIIPTLSERVELPTIPTNKKSFSLVGFLLDKLIKKPTIQNVNNYLTA